MNSRLFASRAPLVFVPMGACKPYIPFTGRQCADRTPPAFFSQCAARACLGPLCAAPIGRRTAVPGGPAPHRGGAFASPLYRKAAGNSSTNCPLPFACARAGGAPAGRPFPALAAPCRPCPSAQGCRSAGRGTEGIAGAGAAPPEIRLVFPGLGVYNKKGESAPAGALHSLWPLVILTFKQRLF